VCCKGTFKGDPSDNKRSGEKCKQKEYREGRGEDRGKNHCPKKRNPATPQFSKGGKKKVGGVGGEILHVWEIPVSGETASKEKKPSLEKKLWGKEAGDASRGLIRGLIFKTPGQCAEIPKGRDPEGGERQACEKNMNCQSKKITSIEVPYAKKETSRGGG